MPFDPNLPANNSDLSSAEMRGQLNALKALIDAQQTQITTLNQQLAALSQQMAALPTMDQVNAAIVANSAGSIVNADILDEEVSNPPTQAQVQTIVGYINYLMGLMRR